MFRVKFVYYKILAYPLTDKLYRNYHIYRNSSAPKRAAVFKIFTPDSISRARDCTGSDILFRMTPRDHQSNCQVPSGGCNPYCDNVTWPGVNILQTAALLGAEEFLLI